MKTEQRGLIIIGCLVLGIGAVVWLDAGQKIYSNQMNINNNQEPYYDLPANYQQTVNHLFIIEIVISIIAFMGAYTIDEHEYLHEQ